MRNLKKALSLALALVMLLGMMVVGAGAAGFEDADKIDENYEVAVAVLNDIAVMQGTTLNDETNFNPKANLTRAEGAAIIYRLVTGGLSMNPSGISGFTDVDDSASFKWASGTIAACRDMGIVSGDTATSFAPGRNLKVNEYAKMLLVVLGYEDAKAGYNGEGWDVNVARDARTRGILLNNSLLAMNDELTREQAAQMAFQALTAEMVEYTGTNISVGDVVVNSPATVRRHSANNSDVNYTYDYQWVQSNITPVRLCEEKFPTLKLSRDGENEFKEAYSVWSYRGVEIEDTKVALNCYTTTKAESDTKWMPNVKKFAKDYDFYMNGVDAWIIIGGNNNASYVNKLTANGREVQVYVNPDDLSEIEKIVVIDTVPGEVTKVNSDGDLTIKLLETDATLIQGVDTKLVVKNDLVTVKADKVDGDFKKGDLVLLRAYGSKDTGMDIDEDYTVETVFAPEVKEEFVVRKNFNSKNEPVSVDTAADKGIEAARNVVTDYNLDEFDVNDKGKDSTLYLDKNGYIVKIVGYVDTTPEDGLIAVTAVYQDLENRELVNRVSGVLSNGETVERIYVKDQGGVTDPQIGQVYWMQEASKSDRYKLVEPITKTAAKGDRDTYVAKVPLGTTTNFYSSHTKGQVNAGDFFYSDSVKFIFANGDNGVTVLNGRQNYTAKADTALVAQALNKDGEISAVFLEAEPDIVSLDDIIFVWTQRSKNEVVGSDGDQVVYYGYKAYSANGEEIEDFFGTKDNMNNNGKGVFYRKDTVTNGDVTAYKPSGATSPKVTAHTILPTVIKTANGTRGDSFVITYNGADRELLTNSRTEIVDLTKNGSIDTPAELNQTMNKDHRSVTVAVVYTEDKNTKTYEAHTIFITEIGKDESYKPPVDEAESVTVAFDGTATKGTDYTVSGLTDNKIESGKTFTVTGANIEMTNGNGYEVTAISGGYTVKVTAANNSKITVTVNTKSATGKASVKFATDAKNREATLNQALCGATVTAASDGSAQINLFISLTVPNWARPATAASNTISYRVYANDQLVDTVANAACTASTAYSKNATTGVETLGTVTLADADAAKGKFPAGADIRVEITEIKYDKVAIKYVDGNDKVITDKMDAASASDIAVGTAITSTAGIVAKYGHASGKDASGADVTVSPSVTAGASGTETKATGEKWNAGFFDFAATDHIGQGLTPTGDSAVTVKLAGIEKLAEMLTIKVDDTDTGTTGTADFADGHGIAQIKNFVTIDDGGKTGAAETVGLKVVAAAANTSKGGNATFNVAMSAATPADKRVSNYEVEITIPGHDPIKKPLNGATDVTFTFANVTENVTLGAANIKVTAIEKLYVKDVEIGAQYITLVFNKDVQLATGKTKAVGNLTTAVENAADVSVSGNKVTFNYANAIKNGAILTLTANDYALGSDSAKTGVSAAGTVTVKLEGNTYSTTIAMT